MSEGTAARKHFVARSSYLGFRYWSIPNVLAFHQLNLDRTGLKDKKGRRSRAASLEPPQ